MTKFSDHKELISKLRTGSFKLWNMRAGFSQEGSFKALLFTMVKNRIIVQFLIQNDVLNTAKLEGLAKGKAEGLVEGKIAIARNLKSLSLCLPKQSPRQPDFLYKRLRP